jgi:hypothetical protein
VFVRSCGLARTFGRSNSVRTDSQLGLACVMKFSWRVFRALGRWSPPGHFGRTLCWSFGDHCPNAERVCGHLGLACHMGTSWDKILLGLDPDICRRCRLSSLPRKALVSAPERICRGAVVPSIQSDVQPGRFKSRSSDVSYTRRELRCRVYVLFKVIQHPSVSTFIIKRLLRLGVLVHAVLVQPLR